MSNLLLIKTVMDAERKRNRPKSRDPTESLRYKPPRDWPVIKYTGKRYECWYNGNWHYGESHEEIIEKINACNNP